MLPYLGEVFQISSRKSSNQTNPDYYHGNVESCAPQTHSATLHDI
jgi:hypothetical protein